MESPVYSPSVSLSEIAEVEEEDETPTTPTKCLRPSPLLFQDQQNESNREIITVEYLCTKDKYCPVKGHYDSAIFAPHHFSDENGELEILGHVLFILTNTQSTNKGNTFVCVYCSDSESLPYNYAVSHAKQRHGKYLGHSSNKFDIYKAIGKLLSERKQYKEPLALICNYCEEAQASPLDFFLHNSVAHSYADLSPTFCCEC
jgi:hypothetical protein